MPGPLPKDPATRRRRNKPTIPTTRLPVSGRKGAVPRPPKWMTLGESAMAFWRWAWKTPAAAAWAPNIDGPAVARRAQLEERWEESGDANLLPRMLLLDDRLSLNPWSRAKNRHEIVGDPEAPAPVVDDGRDDELERRRAEREARLAAER